MTRSFFNFTISARELFHIRYKPNISLEKLYNLDCYMALGDMLGILFLSSSHRKRCEGFVLRIRVNLFWIPLKNIA